MGTIKKYGIIAMAMLILTGCSQTGEKSIEKQLEKSEKPRIIEKVEVEVVEEMNLVVENEPVEIVDATMAEAEYSKLVIESIELYSANGKTIEALLIDVANDTSLISDKSWRNAVVAVQSHYVSLAEIFSDTSICPKGMEMIRFSMYNSSSLMKESVDILINAIDAKFDATLFEQSTSYRKESTRYMQMVVDEMKKHENTR